MMSCGQDKQTIYKEESYSASKFDGSGAVMTRMKESLYSLKQRIAA